MMVIAHIFLFNIAVRTYCAIERRKQMYKYLVFCYSEFYPDGGMNDCKLKTNDLNKVEEFLSDNKEEDYSFQVYDCETGEVKRV